MCGCKDNWTVDIVLWPVMYPCLACQTKSMLFVPISLFLSLSLSFSLLCALSKTLVLPKFWGRKLVGEGANTFFWKISTPIFQFNHPQTVLTDRTLQVKSNCQKRAKKTKCLAIEAKKSHSCNQCGYSAMSATALNTHMLGHSGERPFICTLCGYSSKQVGHLKKDMLIHSGERSFNCTQRNQAFKTSSELKRHILIHRGKKPHVCYLCHYSSANASNLKQIS